MELLHRMNSGIDPSCWVTLYEQPSATADPGAGKKTALVAALLNQCRLLSRNFTQLSLSSKTQCHVNSIVTEGPAFASCRLIMGEGLHSDLGITLAYIVVAQPSIVCHHYSLPVNLKHVTCGRARSVLPRTCRLVNLTD